MFECLQEDKELDDQCTKAEFHSLRIYSSSPFLRRVTWSSAFPRRRRWAESLVKTIGPLSDHSSNLYRGGWGIKAQHTCPLTTNVQVRIATMAKKRFSGVMRLPVDHKHFHLLLIML
jgi:hypothetical protein